MRRRMLAALTFLLGIGPMLDETAGDLIDTNAGASPSARLKALGVAYWDSLMADDPLEATFRGDHRFDDRLPDTTEKAVEARLGRYRAWLEQAKAIAPAQLDADARIDREFLLFQLQDTLDGAKYRGHLIPFNQQNGLPLQFAQSVNWHPAGTAGDVENYLRRLRAFPGAVDGLIATMTRGMEEGRVPPRLVMRSTIPQLRALASPKDSPLLGLIDRLPADWPAADRDRAAVAIRDEVAQSVAPAYGKLADFVEDRYLPACREAIGLREGPAGIENYAYLVRSFTTTSLTPDQVHQIGLDEMAKARSAMDGIRQQVGFAGDLAAFQAHLRTDPRFRNESAAAILDRHRQILARIDRKLPELFGKLPRTDYGLKEIEPYRAKAAPGGYYYESSDDGTRPGYFYVNTSNPDDRPTYTMAALAYHEAVPGHHLQFALAKEQTGRPTFRRFAYVAAFSEGWGLYSESLPAEVGLMRDPYDRMGQLEYNAWRCARLVVDTGMHDQGWSRDRAIDYMLANTSLPRIEVESEIDRYIAWPGQALAYKIGELKIRELRAAEEKRLGDKFDVRAFHDRLLAQGSIPLAVLETWMMPAGR